MLASIHPGFDISTSPTQAQKIVIDDNKNVLYIRTREYSKGSKNLLDGIPMWNDDLRTYANYDPTPQTSCRLMH